jgi:sterol desaturase/sphingolipid hydroxylase (fatty acid hydroxylase superfamily)
MISGTMVNKLHACWLLLLMATALRVDGFAPARIRHGAASPRFATKLVLSSVPMDRPQWKPVDKAKSMLESVSHRFKKDEVLRWRAAAFTFFSTLILCRRAIDVKLVELWTHLTTSSSLAARIFRTDSYEWCLAVATFAVFIHFFGYADRAVRKASEQGQVHPWRKYRLQDRFEADKHRRMIERRVEGGKAVTAGDDVMPPVRQSKWHWQAWAFEFWVYVVPLLTWDILAPRRHRRLAAFGAPTTLKVLGDVAGGLLFYDFLFFCGHVLMHKIPLFYNLVHKKHHQTEEVRACEIVRLSLVEEVLEVGFSIIALNAMGAHPVARSIYNVIIVFLLTELHCGFDFPWTPQNVVPFGLATGSRRHHYHHRFGKHYYQKFFFTVDRLFGFFQKNDGSLKGDSVKKNPYIPTSWKIA